LFPTDVRRQPNRRSGNGIIEFTRSQGKAEPGNYARRRAANVKEKAARAIENVRSSNIPTGAQES
jgi:hypothetical protein